MYKATSVVNGFPGKTSTHGSFGWSSVWLLRGEGRVILAETGPPSYSPLIVKHLAEHGLTPADVTDVLITHAHWDHLGNVSLFPGARRWISKAEYAWACSQSPAEPFISQPLLHALETPGELRRLIDGEGEILPGVRVHAVPGHTPGHLAFEVETEQGVLIFAGDSAKNIRELESLTIDSALDVPTGTASISKLRELVLTSKARIVPGHDVLCELVDGTWRRVAAQRAEISFFQHGDRGPVDVVVDGSDPHVVKVTGNDQP